MQTWTRPCDIDFNTPQESEMGHIKNLYFVHRDTYVAGKTGLTTFQNMDNINGNNDKHKTRILFCCTGLPPHLII